MTLPFLDFSESFGSFESSATSTGFESFEDIFGSGDGSLGIDGVVGNLNDIFSGGSDSVIGTLDTISGGAVSTVSGFIEGLTGFDVVGELSSVLDNGFDFSCWNSTHTPSEMKAKINSILIPWVDARVSAIDYSSPLSGLKGIQDLLLLVTGSYYGALSTSKEDKWHNCSRDSLKAAADWWQQTMVMVQKMRSSYISKLELSGAVLVSDEQTFETKFYDVADKPNSYEGDIGLNVYGSNYEAHPNFKLKVYTLQSFQPPKTNSAEEGVSPSGSSGGSDNDKEESTSSTTKLVVGAVIAKLLGLW